MNDALPRCFRNLSVALVASALLSACGSNVGFTRDELRSLAEAEVGSKIDEEIVSSEFQSTRCEHAQSEACPKSPTPEVEVHVESRSIVFDFSNVQGPGMFSEADFEGFVVELSDTERSLLYATVNPTFTNAELDDGAVVYDRGGVELNLAGVAYDSATLIRIDLLVAPLNLLRNVH